MEKEKQSSQQTYHFILEEGNRIGDDCLDYSVTMLQVQCLDILPSQGPKTGKMGEVRPFMSSLKESLTPVK